MSKEIERKFMVANDRWKEFVHHSTNLRDGILAFYDGRKIRVRFYDSKATLTVKGPRKGLSRDEFEYEIPASDGLELLERHCKGEVLEKTRHHIFSCGREWIVDEYHGILEGIVLAEVELESETDVLDKPIWVGQEVSGSIRYRQRNLVKARKRQLLKESRRGCKTSDK